MHASDRVVIVGMGFGVWNGGRHAGSGRWADVVSARILKADAHVGGGHSRIALALKDGTDVVVAEELPGFAAFLIAAEDALAGSSGSPTWLSRIPDAAGSPEQTILFERTLK